MIVVFDTETNGIGTFHPPTQDLLQLSWIIKSDDIHEKNYFIRGATAISDSVPHDIKLSDLTHDFNIVIDEFMTDLKNADKIVAHNLAFDVGILVHECNKRYIPTFFLQKLIQDKGFCTMKNTIELCKLPKKRGYGYKYPKLMELYYKLFSEPPNAKLHDALEDCRVTLACYEAI